MVRNSALKAMCCVGDVCNMFAQFWSNFKTPPDQDRVRHKVRAKFQGVWGSQTWRNYFNHNFQQLLISYSIPNPGQQHSYLEMVVRGMFTRLQRWKSNRYVPCSKQAVRHSTPHVGFPKIPSSTSSPVRPPKKIFALRAAGGVSATRPS